MLEGFYRRGLLRYKQVESGTTKIIEPEMIFVKVHSKLGVVKDPEIHILYTVYKLAYEELCHVQDMVEQYSEQNKGGMLCNAENDLSQLSAEVQVHAYYLQIALRRYFQIDEESEDFLHLYADWIVSLSGPHEWVYDTKHSPHMEWGRA